MTKSALSRLKPRKIGLLAALAILVGFTPPAAAQQIVAAPTNIKPLSKVDFLPEADFIADTQLIKATPYGDETLEFNVRLPKDWTAEDPAPSLKAPDMLSKKVLGELVKYVSPPRMERRSYFILEALEQTYEVSARNWLINYLFLGGYTMNSMTEYSERSVEAMYVEVHGDITYAVRIRAYINGPRVVVARYYVPQEDFEAERAMQAQAMASFAMLYRPEGGIEKWKTFGFLDQSYFDYPTSWILTAPQIKSIERMRASLHTGKVEGKPDGQIGVYAVSRLLDVTLQDELKNFRAKLVDIQGYKPGKLIETIESPFHKDIAFGKIEAYELNPSNITMTKYEVVIAVLQGEDYYYFVSLLTPSRNFDFYKWSLNMRAFRVIAETMRRYNVEQDDYYESLEKNKKTGP